MPSNQALGHWDHLAMEGYHSTKEMCCTLKASEDIDHVIHSVMEGSVAALHHSRVQQDPPLSCPGVLPYA